MPCAYLYNIDLGEMSLTDIQRRWVPLSNPLGASGSMCTSFETSSLAPTSLELPPMVALCRQRLRSNSGLWSLSRCCAASASPRAQVGAKPSPRACQCRHPKYPSQQGAQTRAVLVSAPWARPQPYRDKSVKSQGVHRAK